MAKLGNCRAQTCCVNDSVCCNVQLTTEGAAQLIYTDTTTFIINGTIVVENNGPTNGPSATLIVNGVATAVVVAPGECESVTVNNINTISVQATPGTGTTGIISPVTVSFSLNYKF
ncbi:S-Ena type endospore appendage [Oceanobacillus profundus]|uniref:DUF3992 domain-containing protein n=1 Tax=Oceanobacillus TaxID=182709 RepID=UPI0026E3872B|nr:S-Ena type endospore appendage [Oceanobacillus profundus]MDO6448969.1 DUF3992 domain-containing protein [Oceanobacillus profundus]